MAGEVEVSNRAFQLLKYIEYKYVGILEEVLAEEAEIMSKPELTPEDEIRLIGLRTIKKYIADQLGIPYMPLEEDTESLIDLIAKNSEVEIEA